MGGKGGGGRVLGGRGGRVEEMQSAPGDLGSSPDVSSVMRLSMQPRRMTEECGRRGSGARLERPSSRSLMT